MQDLIQFREMLSDKQKYLERCSGMRKPNAELEATLSETVEEIKVQLDSLIAKHIIQKSMTSGFEDIFTSTSYMRTLFNRESLKRYHRWEFNHA